MHESICCSKNHIAIEDSRDCSWNMSLKDGEAHPLDQVFTDKACECWQHSPPGFLDLLLVHQPILDSWRSERISCGQKLILMRTGAFPRKFGDFYAPRHLNNNLKKLIEVKNGYRLYDTLTFCAHHAALETARSSRKSCHLVAISSLPLSNLWARRLD